MTALPVIGNVTFTVLQDAVRSIPKFKFPESSEGRSRWLAELIECKKKLVRQVRKDELIPIEKLIDPFLRLIGFANHRRMDVQRIITLANPGWCTYCGKAPCICMMAGTTRPLARMFPAEKPNMVITLDAFQHMDWKVYPNDRSRELKLIRALHLSEEFDEWIVEHLRDSADANVSEETADVLERLISFASTFQIDIAAEIARTVNSLLPS